MLSRDRQSGLHLDQDPHVGHDGPVNAAAPVIRITQHQGVPK
jgi:hypothetical protein